MDRTLLWIAVFVVSFVVLAGAEEVGARIAQPFRDRAGQTMRSVGVLLFVVWALVASTVALIALRSGGNIAQAIIWIVPVLMVLIALVIAARRRD